MFIFKNNKIIFQIDNYIANLHIASNPQNSFSN